MARITLTVNGTRQRADVEDRLLLVSFLRDQLGLTGTHIGCETSQCGACTVLLDGNAVKSCSIFAVQTNGSRVTTIEGLAEDGELHPIQRAFHEKHGLQCGYCTPGMVLVLHQFLRENRVEREADIRRALAGNICRCTGYQKIVEAALQAAHVMRRPHS